MLTNLLANYTIPLSKIGKRKYEKHYIEKKKTDSGYVRIYDEKHIKQRWKNKEKKIKSLEKNLSRLRKKYHEDLKSDDPKTRAIAACVGLIDNTAMRVGNEESVGEFDTFGASTLQKRHAKSKGGKLRFVFIGKTQVKQDHTLNDAAVAKEIRKLLEGKKGKDKIFEYEDGKSISAKVINRYLAEFSITAKDLRGYHANSIMRKKLKSKNWEKALEETAKEVGHEEKTLENQYLLPSLVKKYKPEKSSTKDKKKKKSWLDIPLTKNAGPNPHRQPISGRTFQGTSGKNLFDSFDEAMAREHMSGATGDAGHSGTFQHGGTGSNVWHGSGTKQQKQDVFEDLPFVEDEAFSEWLEKEIAFYKNKKKASIKIAADQSDQQILEHIVDRILGTQSTSVPVITPTPIREPSTAPMAKLRPGGKSNTVGGFPITSHYGIRKDPITGKAGDFHHGIDIGAPIKTPITAIGAGVVKVVGWEQNKQPADWSPGEFYTKHGGVGFGLRVVISHPNGMSSLYGHMSKTTIEQGAAVKKGQVIGYVGQSGDATGPHLDLRIFDQKGNPVDPTLYIG